MVDDEQNKGKTKYKVSRVSSEINFLERLKSMAHMKQCGNILKQCTRCKAYVERRYYDSHNKLCSKSLSILDPSRDQIGLNRLKGATSSSVLSHDKNLDFERSSINSHQLSAAKASLVNSYPLLQTATNEPASSAMLRPSTTESTKIYAVPKRLSDNTMFQDNTLAANLKYNSLNNQSSGKNLNFDPTAQFVPPSDLNVVQHIYNDISILRNQLNEELNQREKLVNEIYKMKKQYLLSEERNNILLATIATLRSNIEDESEKCKSAYSFLSSEINNLNKKCEELIVKVSEMKKINENLQKDVEKEQIDISHLDLVVNAQDNKLRNMNKIETNIEKMHNELQDERQIRKDVITHIQKDILQLKELLTLEVSKNKHNTHNIEKSQTDLEQKLKSQSEDILKIEVLSKESKALMGIVEEDTKKIHTLEETVTNLSTAIATLQKQKQTTTGDPENKSIKVNPPDVFDRTGHLIWKIDNFEEKLKNSIENDFVLQSPIFYSNKYGYALQAEIYLNGLGKWRGRHIAAAVYVVPGTWDPLLTWPIKMTAKVILRDQASKANQAVPIIKNIQIRKKDPKATAIILSSRKSIQQSDSKTGSSENISAAEREARTIEAAIKRQHIFIQHSSLDKFDYIKNNTMYIEIIAENT